VLVLAKNLLISDLYYQHGIAMTLGLFRLAFTVMFERTLPPFMKNTEGVVLRRNFYLDLSIKVLVAMSVFQSFFPKPMSIGILSGAALLLFVRWLIWRPDLGLKKFGNATMYIGYLALCTHLVFEILKIAGEWSLGAFSIHIFTFLCMGIVISSMLVRISKGHTGRKPDFPSPEKYAIILILVSAVFRLFLTLLFPAYYINWILIAAVFWTLAFLILGIRLIPFLLQARIDGKTH
jgi:uncharacterized protein involved in response to NO